MNKIIGVLRWLTRLTNRAKKDNDVTLYVKDSNATL